MYEIMTPGPTQVAENVRTARSLPCTNPDIDIDFVELYRETCEMISELLFTHNETFILGGEGILGLEAACASLTEPKDKVLVIDNGIFGRGFADFVTMYGGEVTFYRDDYLNSINTEKLKAFLDKNHDYKYATLVHCDTPSGVLNDISAICPVLKSYGIMTVVDSVSAMFGEPVKVDEYGIDILCGGSQKVVSAPPGLTFVLVSDDAKRVIKERKTPIASFYANLKCFFNYYEEKWFPYTMPISDIMGFRVAIQNIKKDAAILERHKNVAEYTRKRAVSMGLKLHLESGFSNTVTVIDVPEGKKCDDILKKMKEEHNIMIAGCFAELAGKVIRIGHMGENARMEKLVETMDALEKVISE